MEALAVKAHYLPRDQVLVLMLQTNVAIPPILSENPLGQAIIVYAS
jgi:hypothetical protein